MKYQLLYSSKLKNRQVIKLKNNNSISLEATSINYQKGWEITFSLMESFFGEKEVKCNDELIEFAPCILVFGS